VENGADLLLTTSWRYENSKRSDCARRRWRDAVAVTDFDPELSIKVQGRELTVTLPGSKYSVTYFKRHGQFGLLAKEIVNEDDPRLPLTAGQFLAKAWKLANEKARELGWIV
jgi:hypothetical protein